MSDVLNTIMGLTPTPQQRAAVTAPLEPCLIMAGAGTGKTTVMSARIAWLVAEGHVRPERILGLTFTTKAAGELAARVRRDLRTWAHSAGAPDAVAEEAQPTIATYNAFGAQLLREHSVRIGIEPDARVVVDALRYQLGFRVVANTSVDLAAVGYDPRSALSDLLAMDGAMANYLVDPAAVAAGELELAEQFQRDEYAVDTHRAMVETSRKRSALALLVAQFRAAKAEYDTIDYSDQIRLAAKVASQSDAMRQAVRDQYDIVLLDEYQDTSVSQKVLLQRLFGDGFPVTAVGDPLQSIYRWRGAEISNMLTFPTDFPARRDGVLEPSATMPLSENWRSTQGILAIANDISAGLRELHGAQPLTAGRTDLPATQVEVALLPRLADEVAWVAKRLHEIGHSVPWRDMAVLMRDKKNLGSLVRELEDLGIPVQLADAGALFALPEVREVISYLQVLADPTDNPALARILAGPRWMLGARDLEILGERAFQMSGDGGRSPDEPIDVQLEHIVAGTDVAERICLLDALERAQAGDGHSREGLERMAAVADELRALRKHVGDPLPDLVARVVRTTGLGVESLLRTLPNGASRYDRLAMLFDVVSGFADIDGRVGLDAFLSYVRDSDRYDASVEAELPLTKEAVTVMSMHKSKGLEYAVVALPGMCKGTFPSTTSDKYWPANAYVLPPRYLPGRQHPDLVRLPTDADQIKAEYDSMTAHIKEQRTWDENRLAYVAVTRAAHHLLASGSWWGPTQINKRGPSPYLAQIKEHATTVVHWEPEPDIKKNPFLGATAHPVWPADPDDAVLDAVRAQAQAVRDAEAQSGGSRLTADEAALVAQWDADIEAVREQVRRSAQTTRTVRLPMTLTASQVVALRTDQEGFLSHLVRPMPQRPSRAADRGTAFHTWVEDYYGRRALLDIDSLAGASDDEVYSDDELEALKQAFQAGPFAQRTPHAMEASFVIVVAGRPWRGRVDAVFAGTLADPSAQDRWLVVDWKTGPVGSADPIQLDIYRHAWAQQQQIPADLVEAAFYYVADHHIEPLGQPRTLAQLEELF